MYLLGLLLLASAANAETPKPDPYLVLLDEARAAPVEIFADITFRLLDRVAVKPKAAALEEIFRRAGEAREPLPLRCALRQPPESVEIAQRAHNLNLDGLSLRCRAIQEALTFDPKLARELFEQMVPPEVPRADCGGVFVPDAGVYIRTLAAVAARGAFTPREREKQVPWMLVERGARGTSSSWELVAAAHELPALAHTEKEAGALSAALATSLAFSDSDRGFTSAVREGSLVSEVLAADSRLKGPAMLPALRAFLVRHLVGTRCEDVTTGIPGEYRAFNEAVAGRTDILPIGPDESRPAKLEGQMRPAFYAEDLTFDSLAREIAALAKVPPGQGLWKVRLTADWGFRARKTLANIEDWKGMPGQDALEVFHRKCRLLSRVTDIAPAGETWRIAFNEMVALLEDPAILNRSPAEWLLEVGWLTAMQEIFTAERVAIVRAILSEDLKGSFAYESGSEISQALAGARLPALSLYGRLGLLPHGKH